jgi:hypothetical protein
MTLDPGTRVGPYRIVALLGAGGMGEVYRARDARLDRDVAVKALPLLARADRESVARFEREAQILASLNHPHIARLYGLEEEGGSRYLVLELVEGGTLAERLSGRPLPYRETLTFARQVADALAAAHDKSVVHRDLKPANVGLSSDGQVRVLDFGLAKTFAPDSQTDLTTAAISRQDTVVGTVGYMSPEQARGQPVDRRTDIWAFGCVLYEMLTGRPPFAAATMSDTLAAVLAAEPDWSRLPAETPLRLRWLLSRCLEKDQARRLHDIADARIEIEDLLASGMSGAAVPVAAAPARMSGRERLAWAAAAISLATMIAALAVNRWTAPVADGPATSSSSSVMLPAGLRIAPVNPPGRFAISPDGRRIAIAAQDRDGRRQLWIRSLDSFVPQPLVGTDDAAYPFWSPDSLHVAFMAGGKLKRIPAAGGATITLADATSSSVGSWSRDDVILFTPRPGSALLRISASGGTPGPATSLDTANGQVQHWYPWFLPDGRHFLFFVVGSMAGGMTDPFGVYVTALDATTPPKLVLPGGSNAKYASGHLIFLRDGTLTAQPFDLARLDVTGSARPLAEQVVIAGSAATGSAGAFSVADTGTLVYQEGSVTRSQLTWFDQAGKELGRVGDPADYADAVLSPGASRVAVSIADPAAGTRDLWIFDLARDGARERITFDRADDLAPVWSPDSSRIAYSSVRSNGIHLYERSASAGGPERLVVEDRFGKFAAHWSPDAKYLVYVAGGGIIQRSDLWIAPFRDPAAFFAGREVAGVRNQ